MDIPDAKDIWEVYFKRKQAKYKSNKKKPFTKREKRLMRAAFSAGYGWQRWYLAKREREKEEKMFEQEQRKLEEEGV